MNNFIQPFWNEKKNKSQRVLTAYGRDENSK